MLNLATKPDSGGMPATSSVQAMKLTPRKAMAAGMARPVSGSPLSSNSDGSRSSAGKARLRASACAPSDSTCRERSISSASRNSAASASVELSR